MGGGGGGGGGGGAGVLLLAPDVGAPIPAIAPAAPAPAPAPAPDLAYLNPLNDILRNALGQMEIQLRGMTDGVTAAYYDRAGGAVYERHPDTPVEHSRDYSTESAGTGTTEAPSVATPLRRVSAYNDGTAFSERGRERQSLRV
jgi:hypothetical protein